MKYYSLDRVHIASGLAVVGVAVHAELAQLLPRLICISGGMSAGSNELMIVRMTFEDILHRLIAVHEQRHNTCSALFSI